MVSSVFFLVGLAAGILFLKETLEIRKRRRDYGRLLGQLLLRLFTRKKHAKWRLEHEQSASLLIHSRLSSTSTVASGTNHRSQGIVIHQAQPTYSEVSYEHDEPIQFD